ncbi:hypothetical protein DVH24_019263 [Malus domestica]|uniref:E2F transcription factor CC-MB domain-containing protein n=2 Tax=Malus domestica TaxID=3750 RepID=A0A498I2W9_MALDO|nr:hypothetical protein DVH24_019263 [Malus domestica]
MSGFARAPNRQAPPATAANGGGGGSQILPPLRRHLAFESTKPQPFPPDNYHRFAGGPRRAGDQEPEAILVRSPQLTQKDNNEVGYSDWTSSPGNTNVIQSPLQTPVSAKGGRVNNRSKASKGGRSGPQTPVSIAEVENLSLQEHRLDDRIRWLFVTEDDIKGLPCFHNETLIAIKAPHGTTLEVPDPDEAVDYPQRRYRIILRSTMGPIDVYLVSQFEEKFEDVHGAEPPVNFPIASGSGSNEHPTTEVVTVESSGKEIEPWLQQVHHTCSDVNASQEFAGGMMKIVPSDVDNDADYWLLSDAEVSITDMWRTDSGVGWNGTDILHADFGVTDVITSRPQTPPSRSHLMLCSTMDDSTLLSSYPAGPLLPSSKLGRRNSISTSVVVPAKLSLLSDTTTPTSATKHLQRLHSSTFPNGDVSPPAPPQLDLEFLSHKSSESYTSLKDLLPSSAANSPTAASANNSGYEISIRNRLVKQAAWAYLQPMSSTSGPSGPNFLRRLCQKLSPCLSFFTNRIVPLLSRALRRTLLCTGLAT